MEKALAVCGFGVGSSMVLKMTVEKAFKEKGYEISVENTDISSAKGSEADVIFTNKEFAEQLKNDFGVKVYVINKYTDKEEVGKAVEDYINSKEV